MSRKLADFAMHTAEQAAYYSQCPEVSGALVTAGRLDYLFIDTSYGILADVAIRNDVSKHGMTLVRDEEEDCDVLTFSSGKVVCRGRDCEVEEGAPDRIYFGRGETSNTDLSEILIVELQLAIDDSKLTF